MTTPEDAAAALFAVTDVAETQTREDNYTTIYITEDLIRNVSKASALSRITVLNLHPNRPNEKIRVSYFHFMV